MEAAIGAASALIGSLLNQLSDEFIQAYVASSELGLNATKIKKDLMLTQGLLHVAQSRGVSENLGLNGLVQELSDKADAAEDAIDELHYFIIQDQLDGTKYAEPDLGDGLRSHARHGRHAARYTIGNWLSCFSCSPMQDDGGASTDVICKSHNTTNLDSSNDGPLDKLSFDRVAMSKKIKSVIEEIHSLCDPVSELLKVTPHQSNTISVNLNRPLTGSTLEQDDKLYGRSAIFEQTLKDITSGRYHSEILSVLPIVGPGGIGKTTFTQHLYNDKRVEEHFMVRIWVCVSTNFDVLNLTQQIHSCIPAIENEEINIANGTTNLDQLQKSIANRLKSKRFLIVLDDIWKCDSDTDWKTLLTPFTKGESKGSMVLVTTRFPKIEERVNKGTSPINMQGLDPHVFFDFFQACVFGEKKPDQQYSELIDIGREIAEKLKCSPLAAKTVARLLKKDLSLEHWREVLENNEWKNQTNNDDIMPALKISYDYLPFHLKKCFSYFSLFPEDHGFKVVDMNHFWTALGIIDASYENKNYLEELVENGFLMKGVDYLEDQCYVMHDLLHELSQSVSSQECTNISSFSFSVGDISPSIRHLAITIDDRYDENFRQEMARLKSKINIRDLRTLMIFREYDERIIEILKDTFSEIEGIRVLFIAMESTESLPKNFSKLLHLRYLKIRSPRNCTVCLPSTLPRLHHLIFLDLQDWYSYTDLPKYFSRLVNLRHFIADHELHSNVPEVGKIERLEELKEFHVQKKSVGFELEELGKLKELGGELSIYNLQKVATKGEANKANLALKRNLKILELVWGPKGFNDDTADSSDDDIADGLQPHDNLRELTIARHGGAGPPSWLSCDIPIRYLESLTLEDVSWCTLPPFGQLRFLKRLELKRIARVCLIGPDSGTGGNQSFMHLKAVVISYMPLLERWIVKPKCHLFPVLETIKCSDCPNLLSLPFFPECSVSCTQGIHCPNLDMLEITKCPQLFVSPIPPAPAVTFIRLHDTYGRLIFSKKESFWMSTGNRGALAFQNMIAGSFQFEEIKVDSISAVLVAPVCSHLSATLHTLTINRDQRVESLTEEEEQAFQSLTSLQTLAFQSCPGLRSIPRGLHTLSSLRLLQVSNCPEIRSLPMEGLPASLRDISINNCSTELGEHVKKLEGTYPELRVYA